MLDLRYKNEFDSIINMWYSFGFFESDDDNFKVLKNFFNALKDRGRFLMHTDVNIPRVTTGKFREYEKRRLSGGGFLRQSSSIILRQKETTAYGSSKKNGKIEYKIIL